MGLLSHSPHCHVWVLAVYLESLSRYRSYLSRSSPLVN
uniref:Uncharacterized protein n=1 Tax=Myoviridae sp. ctakU3 TaxID=2825135 RepID=A0A8S5P2J3_9CAUD|nr:MAG TPA: hypothetical protein [Myoviridae sp. ctakU3]